MSASIYTLVGFTADGHRVQSTTHHRKAPAIVKAKAWAKGTAAPLEVVIERRDAPSQPPTVVWRS